MSESVNGTRKQMPDDVDKLRPRQKPMFAANETVPGLSSWVLQRKLGDGGFGEVWLANHAWNSKEKPRAVKFCTDSAARHRLVTHERNVVVRVMKYTGGHPNIVPLLDCNLDGNFPWLMYEYVEGGTLANYVGQRLDLSPPKRLDWTVRTLHAIASALATCHLLDPPLVHRDMKPQNVLMAGNTPRITDFGIASVVMPAKNDGTTGGVTAYAARLPSSLHTAGTRAYAPPEQLFGSPPNPRDDVYALGIIAYQLLRADLKSSPGTDADMELRNLEVSEELTSLIVRSVAMNPDRRPKDATEWETTLTALLQESQQQTDTRELTNDLKPRLQPDLFAATGEEPLPHRESPSLSPSPVERSIAEPVRGEAAQDTTLNSRRFLVMVLGSMLYLILAAGLVIWLMGR